MAIIVSKDRIKQVLFLSLLANKFISSKRVEGVIVCSIPSHKLLIRDSLLRLSGIIRDPTVVHTVANTSLVTHGVRITQVHSCTIAHESIHSLHGHFVLIESCKWSNFHLWAHLRAVASEAKSLLSGMSSVPEVVSGTSFRQPHVNTIIVVLVIHML